MRGSPFFWRMPSHSTTRSTRKNCLGVISIQVLLQGEVVAERRCAACGTSLIGKKAIAKTCSVACNHAVLAARRKAQKWDGVDPSRSCVQCSTSMIGRRPHAQYCSRVCKTAASTARREQDGRGRIKSVGRRTKTRKKIAVSDIRRLLNRQHYRCFYCSDQFGSRYHLDHVVPLSRGGQHSIGNIVGACVSCNSSKKDRFIVEWRQASGVGRR